MDKRQTLRQEEALELVREYKRVIAPKVNYLIEPVLMEENPSPSTAT